MKDQARVVVIGGGGVGGSTLYHLAKKGWSDVGLIERKESRIYVSLLKLFRSMLAASIYLHRSRKGRSLM